MIESTEKIDRKTHGMPTKSNKGVGRQAQSAFDHIVKRYNLDIDDPNLRFERRITVREELLHHMAYRGHASSWVESMASENKASIITVSVQKQTIFGKLRIIKSALAPLFDKRFPHGLSETDKKSLEKVIKWK